MRGIYIPGMEMPKRDATFLVHVNGDRIDLTPPRKYGEEYKVERKTYTLIPVPDHGALLHVLKTERECVSRNCDHNCGACDLSLEQTEILTAYDTLISMLGAPTIIPADPAEEGET